MENSNKYTYLSFKINNEMFAIPIIKVLEILQEQKITRVPNTPKDVKGVINFRGDIIPVFETRTKFGLPERKEGKKSIMIVIEMKTENNKLVVGAIVDTAKDVITIPQKDIKPVPKMSSNFNADFLDGIAKIKEKFIMLLNTDKVFSEDEIATLLEQKH